MSDSSLTSERGLIDIGNKATVKAGTQSGLSQENPLYGKVSVIAGKSFTIGDEAQILSDDLLVSAEKIFDSAIRPRLSARQRSHGKKQRGFDLYGRKPHDVF